MRFTQIALLPTLIFGLAQGLALPETTTAVEAPGAATELGSIVSRAAFTCPAKVKTQCTKCPKAPTKATMKGTKAPKKQTKGKCPKGKKGCKREEIPEDEVVEEEKEEEEQEYNILEARITIDMESIGWGSWSDGKTLQTAGLSVCTVMAVYDKNKFGMAHIPPARGVPPHVEKTGAEVINEYTQKMTARANIAAMNEPQGYLLMSSLLDEDKRELLRKWFRDHGIKPTEKIYEPQEAGSGNLVLSREAGSWPPHVSFA